MKITTIFFLTLIFTLSLVSAITIYSGESVTLELEKPYEYYSIIGNSTEVVLDITQEGNNVTITPSKYSLEDSYEVIFFDKEMEIVVVYSGGGGGGSNTITEYVDRDVIKYVDREVIKEAPEKLIPEEVPEEVSGSIGFSIAAVIGLVILIYLYRAKRRYKNNDESEKIIE